MDTIDRIDDLSIAGFTQRVRATVSCLCRNVLCDNKRRSITEKRIKDNVTSIREFAKEMSYPFLGISDIVLLKLFRQAKLVLVL